MDFFRNPNFETPTIVQKESRSQRNFQASKKSDTRSFSLMIAFQGFLLLPSRESIYLPAPTKTKKIRWFSDGFFLRKVEGVTTATGATDVSQQGGKGGDFCLQNLRKTGVCAIFKSISLNYPWN